MGLQIKTRRHSRCAVFLSARRPAGDPVRVAQAGNRGTKMDCPVAPAPRGELGRTEP